MSATLGERKCALYLTTLRKRDRRRLLAALPASSADVIKDQLRQLERLPVPVADLASEVLGEELRELESGTGADPRRVLALAERLPPTWYARLLVSVPGLDRAFFLSMMRREMALQVQAELAKVTALPPLLAEALSAEVRRVAQEHERQVA